MTVQQDLSDRQGDELTGADPCWTPNTPSAGQEIINQHEKCGEKVVKAGVHEATSVVDVALATPTFDGLLMSPITRSHNRDLESII